MPAVSVDLGELDALFVDGAVVAEVARPAVGAVTVAEQTQFDAVGDAGEQREVGP